jgi:hypothetical protein
VQNTEVERQPQEEDGLWEACGKPEEAPGVCWICGAPVNERHCKIACLRCGFMRDCSDP